jgi:hypothetical protein
MATALAPDFDRRAAEATLVVLRHLLPNPAEGRGHDYIFLPRMAPIERDELVQYLAELPKPVYCVALGLGGALAVAAWPIEPPREATPGSTAQHAVWVAQWRQRTFGPGPVQFLLLGEGGEECTLTFEEFEQWKADYDIPLDHVLDADDPLIAGRGVSAVVRFSRMWNAPPGYEAGGIGAP